MQRVWDAWHVRRHLMLVRHAKSAWDDVSLADHDRPLAPRGVKALPLLRDHVAGAENLPELVICSTARRTVETLGGIRAVLPPDVVVKIDRAVYGASADGLLRRMHAVHDDVGSAMIIGHNPTIQDLTLLLVGSGDGEMRAQVAAKVPTGTAITLSFDGIWRDLGPGTAHLADLFMPRPPRL